MEREDWWRAPISTKKVGGLVILLRLRFSYGTLKTSDQMSFKSRIGVLHAKFTMPGCLFQEGKHETSASS